MPSIVIRVCGKTSMVVLQGVAFLLFLCRGILQVVDGSITEHQQSNLDDSVTSKCVRFFLHVLLRENTT